jgi:hypothetical protein
MTSRTRPLERLLVERLGAGGEQRAFRLLLQPRGCGSASITPYFAGDVSRTWTLRARALFFRGAKAFDLKFRLLALLFSPV